VTEQAVPARPGFGFARRHGAAMVGLAPDGRVDVACRADVKPEIVAELRRHAERDLALRFLADGEFEQLLRRLYESGSDDARSMAADLDEGGSLAEIADALPEPQDLMES
jgi:general secretion pathway protein E